MSGTYFTNQNVEKIQIIELLFDQIYSNTDAILKMSIQNNYNSEICAVCANFEKSKKIYKIEKIKQNSIEKVSAGHIVPNKRGLYKLPKLKVYSQFPFELLTAWKTITFLDNVIVYPEKKGTQKFPDSAYQGYLGVDSRLFIGHRNYVSGDNAKTVDWRASAKHARLLVKMYDPPRAPILHFYWSQTDHLQDFEDKISQIALWIYIAHQQASDYCLDIGTFRSNIGRDEQHFKQCMDALSFLNESDL